MGTFEEAKYYVSFTADLTSMVLDASSMAGGTLAVPDFPADAIEASGRVGNPGFKPELLKSFTGGLSNLSDVALVFLSKPVTDREPAILITSEEAPQLAVKKEVQIVGWGQQTAAPQDPFNPPPKGTVGKKFCATSFVNELGDHEMQIGAGAETSRKCHGDSGGPSYMTVETERARKERVVGITSHAYDQTDCAKGGADTRVDVWLGWIDAEMKKACEQKLRTACAEDQGIIPPERYDPPPPDLGPETSPADDGGAGDGGAGADAGTAGESSGCDCALPDAAGAAAPTALLLAIGVALLARRRRRR
jgi:MYXO-CTERM domain-containing protein